MTHTLLSVLQKHSLLTLYPGDWAVQTGGVKKNVVLHCWTGAVIPEHATFCVKNTLLYWSHFKLCQLSSYHLYPQCEEIGKENEEEKSSVPLEWHHRPPWCFLITLFSRYWQCPLCWFVLVINQTHWWVTLCFKWHWWQWQWSERGYDRMLTTNGPEYNLNKLLANCPITRSTFWHNHYQ